MQDRPQRAAPPALEPPAIGLAQRTVICGRGFREVRAGAEARALSYLPVVLQLAGKHWLHTVQPPCGAEVTQIGATIMVLAYRSAGGACATAELGSKHRQRVSPVFNT